MPRTKIHAFSPSTSTDDRRMRTQISWIFSIRWPCNTLTSLPLISYARKSSLDTSFSHALAQQEILSAAGSLSSHQPRTAFISGKDLTFSLQRWGLKSEKWLMRNLPQMWTQSRPRFLKKTRIWMRNLIASGLKSLALMHINLIDKRPILQCLKPWLKLSFKLTLSNSFSSLTELIALICTGTLSLIWSGLKMVLMPRRVRKKLK